MCAIGAGRISTIDSRAQAAATSRTCHGASRPCRRGLSTRSTLRAKSAAWASALLDLSRLRLSRPSARGRVGTDRPEKSCADTIRSGAPNTADTPGGNRIAGRAMTISTLPNDREPRALNKTAAVMRSSTGETRSASVAERGRATLTFFTPADALSMPTHRGMGA